MFADRPALAPVDRLALLCRLSQVFGSSLDLSEVLTRVIDEVLTAVRGERGFVMLREADGTLSFRVARGLDRATIDDPQFEVSRGVVEMVAREGRPVLTSDARVDDRFRMRRSVVDLGLRSVLCVPLITHDHNLGTIYVDNRLRSGIFGAADLDLLTAIASSAAIAIENARLYAMAVDKGRMERELQLARELQEGLLPGEPPRIAGWEIAARWLPAREVAGDYYDWFPLPDGALAVMVADVCDKGMASALFMALSRSILRASLDSATLPSEGLARANRLIAADATTGMFITLFCAILHPGSAEILYISAGHDPPLLLRASDEGPGCTLLPPTGMALGILAQATYQERSLRLDRGDVLLLYTDGLTDALDAGGQSHGRERLERSLAAHRQQHAAEIVAALEADVRAFMADEAPFDDITLLVARKL